jgi:hypothetical protein
LAEHIDGAAFVKREIYSTKNFEEERSQYDACCLLRVNLDIKRARIMAPA